MTMSMSVVAMFMAIFVMSFVMGMPMVVCLGELLRVLWPY
jgi:hypothetical protein